MKEATRTTTPRLHALRWISTTTRKKSVTSVMCAYEKEMRVCQRLMMREPRASRISFTSLSTCGRKDIHRPIRNVRPFWSMLR